MKDEKYVLQTVTFWFMVIINGGAGLQKLSISIFLSLWG